MDLRGGVEELKYGKLFFALVMGVTIVWSFLVPDAPLFQRPELARIFFWHIPCPLLLTAFMFYGGYCSLRYFLRIGPKLEAEDDPKARREWDARAEAALELGLVFGVLTMATGMLFSLAQWGALWQWDPRQTSFLIALLFYFAYFALRGAMSDPERRRSHSAAYMLTAILPIIFLIYIFPRLPSVLAASFHPTDTIMSGKLKGGYLYVFLTVLTLTSTFSVWLYRLRVRVGLLELKKSYGQLETFGSHSTAAPMVRPIRVPPEG